MKKIVLKIGSSIIAPGGIINSSFIANTAKDVLAAKDKGCQVIIVSSGAIACGANKLNLKKRPTDTHSLMALASLGQIALMDAYNREFAKHGFTCGQILLSWDDFDNRKRFINAKQTIDKLLKIGVIPVINENDAVSDEEIKFGDNDRLSALVSDLVEAGALVIISDVEGLLDSEGNIISKIDKVDQSLYKLVKSKSGKFTCGGMATKLNAAQIVTSSGIKMFITSGAQKMAVSRILNNEALGTEFNALVKVNQARKRWIAFSKKAKGRIHLDSGAIEAVIKKGKSLLNVGIVKIEGQFKRKDSVELTDQDSNIIGVGIVNYSSDELRTSGRKRLEKEVIHRNDFVKAL